MKLLIVLLALAIMPIVQKDFYTKLSESELSIVDDSIEYDSHYTQIPYPNGDVPKGKGVCTDVVIRAYRKLGIDLQKEVHEDMAANFAKYPKTWGLKSTDRILTTAGYQIYKRFLAGKARRSPSPKSQPTINQAISLPGCCLVTLPT